MGKATKTYYPYQQVIPVQNSLKISLTIEKNRYELPLDTLFDCAVRDNNKRKFLFVSKVLGKHIPIIPVTLQLIGYLMANAWYEDIEAVSLPNTKEAASYISELNSATNMNNISMENEQKNRIIDSIKSSEIFEHKVCLKEKTLFIGFAETATGIAQAVFNCFSNAAYIHTTREMLNNVSADFVFNEEHSHAVEHMLYTIDKSFLQDYDRIVLIDDELTTGNTARNLINNLPGSEFGIITILDWRNTIQQQTLNNINNKSVIVSSLIKGTLANVIEYDKPKNFDDGHYTMPSINNDYSEILIKEEFKYHQSIISGGRFGITSTDQIKINTMIEKNSSLLKNYRITGKLLCLGTEEFIYIPCKISSLLGDDVYFHSSTRSPIISFNEESYCIKNKFSFPSPYNELRKNYIYNIPRGLYNQVFIYFEKNINDQSKYILSGIFKSLGIESILFIIWD